MIKDFKLEILIFKNSFINKHLTPLHQTSYIIPIFLLNWTFFVMLEVLGWRLQMFFQLQK